MKFKITIEDALYNGITISAVVSEAFTDDGEKIETDAQLLGLPKTIATDLFVDTMRGIYTAAFEMEMLLELPLITEGMDCHEPVQNNN